VNDIKDFEAQKLIQKVENIQFEILQQLYDDVTSIFFQVIV